MSLLTSIHRFAFDVPVRFKILGIGFGIAVLFGTAMLGVVRADLSNQLRKSLIASGRFLAEDLARRAAEPVAAGDARAVERVLAAWRDRHEHFRYALVLDRSGTVIARAAHATISGNLRELERVPDDLSIASRVEAGGEQFCEVRAALVGEAGGEVRIGLSERGLQEAVRETTRRTVGALGVCSGVGFISALILTRAITRPIRALVELTSRVGKGDLTARASNGSGDEIGALARSFNEMIERLDHYRQEVSEKEAARTKLLDKIITAQEEERKRIARELHDGAGQALTSVLIRLRLLIDSHPEEETAGALADLKQEVSRTLEEIRSMAVHLRPSALDDHGVVNALHRYVQDFSRRTGVATDFQAIGFDAADSVDSRLGSVLYRVAQEALTNVAKHAGARQASVVLQRYGDRIQLHVEDDGVGFRVEDAIQSESTSPHLGLLGMRERAALADGTLTVESSPGGGTSVRCEIPWVEAGTLS